ncbi:MAG: PQQ-dependent sugar dehydrogenase [Promethearchaeota archaeon]|jgi:glucose/arabinose dehydrogenase
MKLKKMLIIVSLIIILMTISVGSFLIFNSRNTISSNLDYKIQVAFPNLDFTRPVGIYDPNDSLNRLFVVEQGGKILVFENNPNTNNSEIFLDLSNVILFGGERGLLGLAFHPNYKKNGYFYTYYTKTGTGNSVISRFKVNTNNINLANISSEVILLQVAQPNANHNGGQIQFGPDGYLYIALGDGGGSGDPGNHGQNRQTMLGAILRIDINSGLPYTIPNDNPFFGNIYGWAEEIYAFGFRNPWRFSFDNITGSLWTGDVGQSTREEIDIVEIGKNYGWNTMEGTHIFNPGSNVTKLEPPIYEYGRNLGVSITGGYVYRGLILTELYGKYIYGDYGSGRIWALDISDGITLNNTLLIDTDLNISSFGEDLTNELYICAFDGNIYKLTES